MISIQQAIDTALAHQNAGRYAEAESLYRQVLQVDPKNFDALQLLAQVAHKFQQFGAAIDLYKRALQDPNLSPRESSVIHSNMGETYRASYRYEEALACFRIAVQLAPDSAISHNNLGLALWSLGWLDEAVISVETALRLDPDTPLAHRNLAKIHEKRGEHGKAAMEMCQETGLLRFGPESIRLLGKATG